MLVVSEVALALILLVGAALLIRTYIALRAVDPGFDAQRVLTMRMSLTGARFENAAAVGQLMRDGSGTAGGVAGSRSRGGELLRAAAGRVWSRVHHRRTTARRSGARRRQLHAHFRQLFQRLQDSAWCAGAAFTEQDTTGAPGVVIINQAMAREVLARR